MCQVSSRCVVASLFAALAVAYAAILPQVDTATAAEPKAGPSKAGLSQAQVDANYRITLNGFDLGSFRFKSNVGRAEYAIETDVRISALLGVFQWKGVTQSSGIVKARAPQPANFRFDYESSLRSGSVKMGFDGEGIESLSVVPVLAEAPDSVPLTRSHLKGVVDPLSAIMSLTHTDAATPCGRTVQIFDGRQRFDIALRFARKERLATGETAIVCRVKYTPIAGYRPTPETRQLATSNAIEITFRVVPAAKLMLPQTVTVPTPAGEARINLEQVSVSLPDRGRIASAE